MVSDIVQDDILLVRWCLKRHGQCAYVVRTYDAPFVQGTVSTAECAQWLDISVTPSLFSLATPVTDILGCYVRRLVPTDTNPSGHSNSHVTIPGDDGEALPYQCCPLIRLRTLRGDRHGKGRVYPMFPPVSARSENGEWTNDYIAQLQSLGDILSQGTFVFGSNGMAQLRPVIWDRKTNAVTPVSEAQVSAKVATQRRRGLIRATLTPEPFDP